MKKNVLLILICVSFQWKIFSQTSMVVTNSVANAVLFGNYTPSTYNNFTGLISNPTTITNDLQSRISADTLKSYVQKLSGFYTRNTLSISSTSTTTGLNATNKWIESKFSQFSAQNSNRLIVSRMNYNAIMSSCTSTNLPFYEVFAVLPGSDLTDKSLTIVEAHVDSRNDNMCDVNNVARGVSDNACGAALVIELARCFVKYQLKGTVVFLVTTGEEQGLFGSKAFSNYLYTNNIKVRMVMDNDIAATTYCGQCSSSPSCTPGNITTNSIRIFSYGSINSNCKQQARYTKLEYKEQILPTTTFPMTINIMADEDRVGRGSDHQPFRQNGYPAMRTISQNENGDGSACGVVHTIKDNEQLDVNNDGILDVFNVDYDYLKRNAVINSTAIAMACQSVIKPTAFAVSYVATNKLSFTITDATNAPAYRIALRSLSNDWDTVYTVTGKTVTIPFVLNSSTVRYVSIASVNSNGVESIFSAETTVNVPAATVAATNAIVPAENINLGSSNAVLEILENRPNPFDESTYAVIKNNGSQQYSNAFIVVRDLNGATVLRNKVVINPGMNQFLLRFNNYISSKTMICTLECDGKIVGSKMILKSVIY